MGKSVTPKYRVETKEYHPNSTSPHWQKMVWEVKSRTNVVGYGSPNTENLFNFIIRYSESFKPGGVNQHIGFVPAITQAKIVNQFTGQIMASWTAPMFQVVEVC